MRDHIEKVVESLVGDNLDSVNIIYLSSDANCELLSGWQAPGGIQFLFLMNLFV